MVLKNSLKQLVRTPLRTVLFILFLAATTTFLCFGLYMWVGANNSLDQASEAFSTVGIIEFSDSYYLSMPDLDFLAHSPYVEHFDRREILVACNYEDRKDPDSPPIYIKDRYAVIIFEPLSETSGESVPISVVEFMPFQDELDHTITSISNSDHYLEVGKLYISAGTAIHSEFRPFATGILEAGAIAEIPQGNLENFLASADGKAWATVLKASSVSQRFTVLTSKDVNSIYAFHQGDAILTEGRLFTQQEYEDSAQVCLVSIHSNLQLGESIDLTLYDSESLHSGPGYLGFRADPYVFDMSIGEGTYEVVGVYSQQIGSRGIEYGLDQYTIIVPHNPAISEPDLRSHKNNLLSVRLVNGTANDFLADIETANLTGVTVLVYDQGYSMVSAALTGLSKTALLLMTISLATGLILAILFAYLYVGKQKHNIAIMYSLGESRRQALAYILSTTAIVVILATTLGGLAGYLLSGTVLDAVYQRMEGNVAATVYSTVTAGLEIQHQIPIPRGTGLPMVAAGAILLMTLAISVAITVNVLRVEPLQLLANKGD